MSNWNVSVAYYIDDKLDWTDDNPGGYYPTIGAGIVWDDGNRYRVVDTWLVQEKHGVMTIGTLHVRLHPVAADQDWPAQLHPDYFTPPRSGKVW